MVKRALSARVARAGAGTLRSENGLASPSISRTCCFGLVCIVNRGRDGHNRRDQRNTCLVIDLSRAHAAAEK